MWNLIEAYFEIKYIGLYWNVRAGLNVNVILLAVWINISRRLETSTVSMQFTSPFT